MEIENNIPLPPRNGFRRKAYPFLDLKEPGQSFVVPVKNWEWAKTENRVRASFHYWKRVQNLPFTITTRRVENGIRVWRIEQ